MSGLSEFLAKLGSEENTKDVIKVLEALDPEPYINARLLEFRRVLENKHNRWDICSVLTLYSKMLKPATYAEIGVRKGKSMACMLAFNPDCTAYGFDAWMPTYFDVRNPGPEHVREELKKVGYKKTPILIKGDSHVTVPKFLKENLGLHFDVVLVDGDHSPAGATKDLNDLGPRTKPGGILVFDDTYGDNLLDVWKVFLDNHKDFTQIAETNAFSGTVVARRKS